MSKAELRKTADLIIVGKAVGPPGTDQWGLQTIHIKRILKGSYGTSELMFMTEAMIAEQEPRCCRQGRIYKLYLQHALDGTFKTVDGHYGAVEIRP
jgi:hypothetical protein